MKAPRAPKKEAAPKRQTAPKKPRATASDRGVPAPKYDQVAALAYELFLQRGGAHGHHEQDWLLAEQQLLGAES